MHKADQDVQKRRRWLGGALLLGLGIAGLSVQAVLAQPSLLPGILGRWTTLPDLMPINPVHVAVMGNGKVLIVSVSGNVATNTNFEAAVWDPVSRTLFTQPLAWDMFCNGMVTLPDGRVFINGGNLRYDPFYGEPRNAVFDVAAALAAVAALDDVEHVRVSMSRNVDDRQEFFNQANARMVRTIDSQTNFVMVKATRPAVEIVEHFRKHDILIGPPFPALDKYIRVSVGRPAQMREFWRVWDLMPGHHNMSM